MFKKVIFKYLCVAAIALSAALASCGKDDDKFTVSGTISGKYSNWSELSASFDMGDTWAATVQISNGKFKISLPEPGADFLAIDFSEDFNVSDQSAKIANATLWVRDGDEKEMLSLITTRVLPSIKATSVTYMYADKKVNVDGDFDVTEGVQTVNIVADMKLNKGWNIVVNTYEQSSAGAATNSLKSAPVPSGSIWMVL